MKKWILSTTLTTAFLFQASAGAWGHNPMGEDGTRSSEIYVNKNDNPNYFLHGEENYGMFRVSYLYWRPTEGEMSFTAKNKNPFGLGSESPDGRIALKDPHFDWSSGVRATLGMYMPYYDQWDLSFTTTFFYADASNHVSVPADSHENTLTPSFYVGVLGDFSSAASARWKMNFFIFDLSMGREYFLTNKITARPFMGLRGVILDQDYNIRYTSTFVNGQGAEALANVKTKLSTDNDFTGVGLRLGSDVGFQLPAHFAFIGSVSGSLVYGRYDVSEKVLNGHIQPGLNLFQPKIINDRHQLVSNIEGSIGLKWERWLSNGNSRLALAVAVEAQQWYDINKLIVMDNSTTVFTLPTYKPSELDGNLGIFAYNFSLQYDF